MNRGVKNVEVGDRRCSGQAVGVEELWLGDSTVGSLSIPPFSTIAVQGVSGVARHDNVFS